MALRALPERVLAFCIKKPPLVNTTPRYVKLFTISTSFSAKYQRSFRANAPPFLNTTIFDFSTFTVKFHDAVVDLIKY